jgi:hypothetical protein
LRDRQAAGELARDAGGEEVDGGDAEAATEDDDFGAEDSGGDGGDFAEGAGEAVDGGEGDGVGRAGGGEDLRGREGGGVAEGRCGTWG